MDNERKNISWVLIAAVVVLVGTALVFTTLTTSPAEQSQPAPTVQNSALPAPSVQPQMTGGTANASVIGYGGPVLVRLTLDETGTITGLDVGGARFAETEGVGARVREEAFTKPFIGQKPPLTLGKDIDALSGATISSQATVDAVNEAAAFLQETPSDTK